MILQNCAMSLPKFKIFKHISGDGMTQFQSDTSSNLNAIQVEGSNQDKLSNFKTNADQEIFKDQIKRIIKYGV